MSASLGFLGGGTIPLSGGMEYSGGEFFRRYGSILMFLWIFLFLIVVVSLVRMAEVPTTGWEEMAHVVWLPNCGGGLSAAGCGGFGGLLQSRWSTGFGGGGSDVGGGFEDGFYLLCRVV